MNLLLLCLSLILLLFTQTNTQQTSTSKRFAILHKKASELIDDSIGLIKHKSIGLHHHQHHAKLTSAAHNQTNTTKVPFNHQTKAVVKVPETNYGVAFARLSSNRKLNHKQQELECLNSSTVAKNSEPSIMVTLLLFTQPDGGKEAEFIFTKQTQQREFLQSRFNPRKKTIILIHGWRGARKAFEGWAIRMKDLILCDKRYNVIIVDWRKQSLSLIYSAVVQRLERVAQELALIINNLSLAYPKFDKNKLHLIGHSLGAHVAGILGNLFGGNVSRITALDPAGPLFFSRQARSKLTRDDAKLVVAEHTSIRVFGSRYNIGHVDIFINGGKTQPACERPSILAPIEAVCSHRQSTRYNSVYVGKCIMMAYACSSYQSYLNGECGFCEPANKKENNNNKIGCHPVGQEWQYRVDKGLSFGPEFVRKNWKQNETIRDKPWTVGSRISHFVKTGASRPYCLFTYQVVVKFDDILDLADIRLNLERGFGVVLVARESKDRISSISFNLTKNHVAAEGQIGEFQVFNNDKFFASFDWISAKNTLIKLIHFDVEQNIYAKMPLKFTEARLSGTLVKWFKDKVKIYINFMSHFDYEQRRSYSGQVRISWNLKSYEQLVKV